jgi:ABC-type transporter Mla subunit MlaD
MSRKFNPALIGAFVLGAALVALAAVALFGSGRLWRKVQTNVVYFGGSVKGLTVGSPVMFRGVPIGQVKDIRVICDTRDLSFRIPVLIETDIDKFQVAGENQPGAPGQASEDFLQLLVKRGLRAQLQMQSLVTGQLFVQLDLFPGTEAHFVGKNEKYPEIPSVLSNFEEVSRTLQQIPLDQLVQKVMMTMDGIEKLVNSPELGSSIRSLDQVLREVRSLAKGVNAEMGRLAGNVSTTMGTVDTLARHLDAQVVPVSQNLQGTLQVARGAFARAESALQGLDSTLAPQAPERAALRQALQELAAAARAVRVLAEALELQPEMLLKGRQGEP